MTDGMKIGREGEELACGYLVEKGFQILKRNERMPGGELDIIALSPDRTLVFVEVKTVSKNNTLGIGPEDEMSRSKLNKFRKAAYLYANSNPKLIDDEVGWRLDVLAITKTGSSFGVTHYENV
ncbi:MAG: YraN family protein [Candidatus Jorgensenbacteria bacterium]|nr:YraN family protein [Candidatus Jorgensenbacteria bacterium]